MFRRFKAVFPRRRAPGLLVVLGASLWLGCDGSITTGAESSQVESAAASRAAAQDSDSPDTDLGEGFLVWESNRTGAWRIWTRKLEAPEPRQLSPDQGSRQHCCPHISPDGTWIAYLGLDGVAGYAAGGARGELRLIRPDGTDDHAVGERARSLHENRGVVWRSSNELIYLRENLTTWSLDITNGRTEELVAMPDAGQGWLLNPQLTHAVTGRADFSPYDAPRRSIAQRNPLGGCQPYFSHDGRWGFWTAGTGGPVHRIDLATGATSSILKKADPRVPRSYGYAYFPMFSSDGRLFAFAGSPYVHDHFNADYEVFVAEADPETLELTSDAVRMTFDPATDRFPDVHLAPLELGRHRGEAPFEVRFEPASGGRAPAPVWKFDFGDGSSATGTAVSHTFSAPGRYTVRARPEDETQAILRGRVSVNPATAPRPVAVSLAGQGRSVIVRFDEDIFTDEPEVEFASGRGVTSWTLGADGRSLVVIPATRIDRFDSITLDRIGDRAQQVNWMERTTLEIEPPLWPSDRTGLVFLWETGKEPNLVADPVGGSERACALHASGGARLDHDFALALGAGRFTAAPRDSERIFAACTTTNECSIEAVLLPEASSGDALREIISFSNGTWNGTNFLLAQRGDRLIFQRRMSGGGPGALAEVDLGPIAAGSATHVVISFETGRLEAFVNGEQAAREALGAGFFHWRQRPLVVGQTSAGGTPWVGKLEGLAAYDRFVEGSEAMENHLRYRETLRSRPEVPRWVVEATLVARSPAPSLEEITPYREALAVFEYRIDRVIEGRLPGERIRVAHWVILDGAALAAATFEVGSRRRLTLEPYADNPQLESSFLADALPSGSVALFYSVAP